MQLEGRAYNWYIWWKITTNVCSYGWYTFKNDFFKRFQDVVENDYFAKITRLQQKGDVEESTYEWEALETRVPELTDNQRLQTYVYGLKPYITDKLELHNISNMDKVRRKEKIIEQKSKRTWQKTLTKAIFNEGITIANIAEANGYQGINARIQNIFHMKLTKTQTYPLRIPIRMKNGSTTNHSYQCKIIEGKEVQVVVKDETYDSYREENLTNVSLASITCMNQVYKKEESNLQNHVKPDKMEFVLE